MNEFFESMSTTRHATLIFDRKSADSHLAMLWLAWECRQAHIF